MLLTQGFFQEKLPHYGEEALPVAKGNKKEYIQDNAEWI